MEWLKGIFDRILSVFPRILILSPFEGGIRVTFGKYLKVLPPGWYLYWGLIQKVYWVETQTQVVDLRNQSIQTKDGQSIVVSGAIQYSIKNVQYVFCNVQDFDKALETLSLGIILEFVKNRTLEECQDIGALKSEILRGIKEAARGWGLKIEKVFITDLSKTRNIRLLTNKFNTEI